MAETSATGSGQGSGGGSLAARLGLTALDLEVVASARLTPNVQEVTLRSDALSDFSHRPGQDLMLDVPVGDAPSARRRYTIRRADNRRATLDINVVLHGDGPATRWASEAGPGDRIRAVGPRGRVTVAEDADWHLFVGDDSFLPAALAMIEALPSGTRASLITEVDVAEDEQEVWSPAHLDDVVFAVRNGAPAGTAEALVDLASSIVFPDGRGHAYIGGELKVVGALRRTLTERGLGRDQLSPKPYWRRGVANVDRDAGD